MPNPTLRDAALGAALVLAAACGSNSQPNAGANDVAWDTLPSGAVHAVYSSFPVLPLTTTVDLRLGGTGAEGPGAFGDVRGIDVDAAGRILVLDGRAAELRAFDADGAPVGVIMQRGPGPSAMEDPSGIRVDTSGAIWVSDHGRGTVTRLKDGRSSTYPRPAAANDGVWEGGVTHDGRVWDFARHPLDGSDGSDRPGSDGPRTRAARLFLKRLDPSTGGVDSAALATETEESVAYRGRDGVHGTVRIPFKPRPLVAIDPAGAVWTATSDVDRLVKLSPAGDTLLVVELPGAGPDVPADERAKAIERLEGFLSETRGRGAAGSDAPDWESIVPRQKPVLVNLSVDDRSRLWVQRRTLSRGPVFDVLDADGRLLGSIDPDFAPAEHFPIVVRGKSLYAVLIDSLDVATVVRAPVPLR